MQEIKERLKKLKLTRQQLAQEMNVSLVTVNNIVNAHHTDIKISTLVALSKALKLSVNSVVKMLDLY